MGLFQNLLLTYEKCKDSAGIVQRDTNEEAGDKKTFLPIFHMTFKSQICITLDSNGSFVDAVRDRKDITIIIPCTETSAGRSGQNAPHPLCDQLDYLSGINTEKTEEYLKALALWGRQETGTPKTKLEAIYAYISAGNMITDLEEKQLFKDAEYDVADQTKTLNHEKTRKLGIRFTVDLKDDLSPNVWVDQALQQSWIDYIKPKGDGQQQDIFDYMGGEKVGQVAKQHPKNINSMTGNAKLLSCNDTSGYTFRGRFSNQDEAIIIDYEQSQKMHQTLRWLINNYGYNTDSQTIAVWAVDDDTSQPPPYKNSRDLFADMDSAETDMDKLSEAAEAIDANYAKKLTNLFQGLGSADKIKAHAKTVCIAVFDAATTGRMGPTFYQELPQDEYLENIVEWHEDTSYYLTAWTKEKDDKNKEKSVLRHYIGAPSYDDILFAVHGKSRSANDAGYNTLKKKVRKQLLECMFGNFPFPKSMMDMAAVRASQPMSFGSESDWNRTVSITCALVRKYYKKQKKEEMALDLDETRAERDYLYGRLLAVADRLEQTAVYKAGKPDDRATNAVRLMAAFAVKPYHTWGVLYQQLIPYIHQLKGAGYYQSIIDSIMVLFGEEYENNAPLSPLYLLGFSAQRRAFFKNKKDSEDEENGTTA